MYNPTHYEHVMMSMKLSLFVWRRADSIRGYVVRKEKEVTTGWKMVLWILFFAGLCPVASLLSGCAQTQKQNSLLDYTKSAKQMYEVALEEFDDEDCVEADKLFQDVRRQFPYSRYAPLAELRIADCHFIQGSNAEAAVSYQHFVQTHPTHEEAHYAAYKRGVAYYEMIPGDWIITPPPHERDQSATRDARSALGSYLKVYPKSPWKEKATDLLKEVVDALVRHEMYVAEFYLKRKQRKAAVVRLEGIWIHFPDSSLVPDAMFMQAKTFLEMDRADEAMRVFKEIIARYPDHHQSPRARDYLRYLAIKPAESNGGNDG